MIIYFGGAYNGKLSLVLEKYNLKREDIFFCRNEKLEFDKKIISGLDKLILNRALAEKESLSYIKDNLNNLKDKIIIVDQISEGIVPIKKEERFWREETGKTLQQLIKESDEVYRVFFSLEKRLK